MHGVIAVKSFLIVDNFCKDTLIRQGVARSLKFAQEQQFQQIGFCELHLLWNFQSLSVKKLAGQTAIYGLSTVVGRFLNVFLTFWLTYVYGAEKFAIFSLAYAYVTFLNVVFTYGMETSFFRFAQRPEYKNDVYNTALMSLLITTILFSGAMIIFIRRRKMSVMMDI